jgi:hypothetical protein
MHGHRWPTLHTAMRVLAVAAVLTFAFSAVSIAYAAGRYTTRDDSIGGSCAQPLPTCVWAGDG